MNTIDPSEPLVHHITAAFLAALDPAERAEAERLAEARQDLAEGTGRRTGWYAWAGLSATDRAAATVAALHYLRAARSIGLIPMATPPEGS